MRQDGPVAERFAFGRNWQSFIELLDDQRAADAQASLRPLGDIKGQRFLDIGSGSGIFSLGARGLGAEVVSFDYDAEAVACTEEVRRRFRPDDDEWSILQGSVLDVGFLEELGTFDVVYSWGVLHHTGEMWRALDNAIGRLRPGGRLFISIYNRGNTSPVWVAVKRRYNKGGALSRWVLVQGVGVYFRARRVAGRLVRGSRTVERGMDWKHDLIDWVGGWPFEAATAGEVFAFCHERGLRLEYLTTTSAGSLGCNEFLFVRA